MPGASEAREGLRLPVGWLRAAAGLVALTGVLGLWAYGVIGAAPTPPSAAVAGSREVVARPGEPVRILFLGTSLSARGDWPARVAAALGACAPQGVVVERLATPGAGSRWGWPAFRDWVAAGGEADIVVAEFAINDAVPLRGSPLWIARDRYAGIVVLAREAGAVPVLATMSPAWGTEAWQRPGLARYLGAVRDVAAAEGAGLVDAAPAWVALDEATRVAFVPDGLHPTDEGQAAVTVPAMVEGLKPLVCGTGAAGED